MYKDIFLEVGYNDSEGSKYKVVRRLIKVIDVPLPNDKIHVNLEKRRNSSLSIIVKWRNFIPNSSGLYDVVVHGVEVASSNASVKDLEKEEEWEKVHGFEEALLKSRWELNNE